MLSQENIDYLKQNQITLWDKSKRDEYLHKKIYKDTNRIWCQCRFNTRKSIGHVMELLKECNPSNFDEWQDFYFKSGDTAFILKRNIVEPNPKIYNYEINKIDQTHGKSVHDMVHLAIQFKQELAAVGLYINLETSFNFAVMRAIDQPFVRL